KPSQTLEEWQTEVCNLAVECEFGTLIESMMLAVFLGGLRNDELRIHLHTEKLSTLEEAVDAAQLYEAQRALPVKAKQLEQPEQEVNALEQKRKGQRREEDRWFFRGKCFNCDKVGHRASDCRKPRKEEAELNAISIEGGTPPVSIKLHVGGKKLMLQVD